MDTSWNRLFHAIWATASVLWAPQMPAQGVPGPQAAPRLMVTPGINNTITSLQFSEDDTKLLAGSIGASFLWDVPTGQLIRVFPGHSFTYPKWGPNDETILSPDSEGYVTLYKAATGEVVYSIKAHEHQVYQAVFSKDRKTFLTAGGDRATLWETETGKAIRSFPHWETTKKGKTIVVFARDNINDNIESVAFDEATGTIITCGNPGKIRIWNVSNGKVLKTIEGPFTNTRGLQIDEKNRILYSHAIDSDDPGFQPKTRSWNLDNGQGLGVLPDLIAGISSGGDMIATTRKNDGILYLKNATTLEDVRAFKGHARSPSCMGFSHNGTLVATGGADAYNKPPIDPNQRDATVRLWDLQTEKETARLGSSWAVVGRVAVDEAGTILGVLNDNGVHLVNLNNGSTFRRLKDPNAQSKFMDFTFVPGHPWVITGSIASPTTCWNYLDGKEVFRFGDAPGGGAQLSISKDGSRLHVVNRAVWNFEGTKQLSDFATRVWEVPPGRLLGQPKAGEHNSVISPDGEFVLGAIPNGARTELFKAVGGEPVGELSKYGSMEAFAFHPAKPLVYMADFSYPHLQVWDYRQLKQVTELRSPARPPTGYLSISSSKSGSHLFAGGRDYGIHIWNTESGRYEGVLNGHIQDPVSVFAATSDRYVWSGGKDATVRVWDSLERRELCRLFLNKEGNALVVAPDGRLDVGNFDTLSGVSWFFADDPFRGLKPEVFMRDYYEPRLLPRLLAGEKFEEVRSLQNLNRAQPAVSITAIRPGEKPGHVDIDVQVTSAVYTVQREGKTQEMKSGAYDLRVFRNGRLVAQWPPVEDDDPVLEEGNSEVQLAPWRAATRLVGKDEGSQTIPFKGIRLPFPKAPEQGLPSTVEWTAYAFNEDRVKSTTARQANTLKPGSASQPHLKRKAYLLSIGVSSYESPALNLQFADDDARKMIATLSPRLEKSGYEVVTEVLVSEGLAAEKWQATKEAIRKAMEKLAAAVTPDDLVIVSFSSHGYTDARNEFYLLPSDIGQGRARDHVPGAALLSRCISGEELSRWMRRIDAGEMVLIIDACHSAAVVEQPWFKPGPMGCRGLGQLAYDKRMRVLAASQANDYAIEASQASGIGQGLLTYALTTDGLENRTADHQPQDGKIELGEWLAWGVQRVPELHQTLRIQRSVTQMSKGVHEKANLIIMKAAGDGAMTRQFVAEDEDDLKESSLAKDRPAQSPQLFDFALKEQAGIVLEEVEKP